MDKDSLLLKVETVFTDKMDGDDMLYMEQMLDTAIRKVSKEVVYSGHETSRKLLDEFEYNLEYDDVLCLYYFELGDTNKFILDMKNRFHDFKVQDEFNEGMYWGHPMNNLELLEQAENNGCALYYCIHKDRVYIAFPHATNLPDAVTLRHYTYPTITTFPDEMEEFLVKELVNLLTIRRDAKQARRQ